MWADLSYDIFLGIVDYISIADLNTCSIVCTKWNSMSHHKTTWARKCRQRWGQVRVPVNWRGYYILRNKEQNLIFNPSAFMGFDGWISRNTCQSKWSTKPVNPTYFDYKFPLCFMSASGNAVLFQSIDLLKKGYLSDMLDTIPFEICVNFLYMPEQPICKYTYCIEIISQDMITLEQHSQTIKFWKYNKSCKKTHISWNCANYTFVKTRGVRYINIIHHVESHYNMRGINITGHSVKVIYAQTSFVGETMTVFDLLFSPVDKYQSCCLIDYDFTQTIPKNSCLACNNVGCVQSDCNVEKCAVPFSQIFNQENVMQICSPTRTDRKKCSCKQCFHVKCAHTLTYVFFCNNIKCIGSNKYYKPCKKHDNEKYTSCVRCVCNDVECIRCIICRQIYDSNDLVKCYNLNCYYINTVPSPIKNKYCIVRIKNLSKK
ncbi:putative F-box-containing protein [Namao virus]|nr:putative F-box-containing protein [Namao virus]